MQKSTQVGRNAAIVKQKARNGKAVSHCVPFLSPTDDDYTKERVAERLQEFATFSATATEISGGPRRGSTSGIRVIAYSPPASASRVSHSVVTPDSPEPRPPREMCLAALRTRYESASAERLVQKNLAGAATAASKTVVRAARSLNDDDVVTSSPVVRRSQGPPAHHGEFSASPFSMLSTPASNESNTASCSLLPPPLPTIKAPAATATAAPLDGVLINPATSSATLKEGLSSVTRQLSRSGGGGDFDVEGSSLATVPLAPRVSTAETPPLTTFPTPSAASSGAISPWPPVMSVVSAAVAAAASHGAASTERPAVTGTRPTFCSFPSNISSASTVTLAEAPIAERSFGVFSWRDSPPSRMIRAAPMQPGSNSTGKEEQVEVVIFEDEDVEVDWYGGTPPLERSAAILAPHKMKLKEASGLGAAEHFMKHIALLQKSTAPPAPVPSFTSKVTAPQPSQEPCSVIEAAEQLQQKSNFSNDGAFLSIAAAPVQHEAEAPRAFGHSGPPSWTGQLKRHPQEGDVASRAGAKPKCIPAPLQPELIKLSGNVTAATAVSAPVSLLHPQELAGTKAQQESPGTRQRIEIIRDTTRPAKGAPPTNSTAVGLNGKQHPVLKNATATTTESNTSERHAPLRKAYSSKQRSTPVIATVRTATPSVSTVSQEKLLSAPGPSSLTLGGRIPSTRTRWVNDVSRNGSSYVSKTAAETARSAAPTTAPLSQQRFTTRQFPMSIRTPLNLNTKRKTTRDGESTLPADAIAVTQPSTTVVSPNAAVAPQPVPQQQLVNSLPATQTQGPPTCQSSPTRTGKNNQEAMLPKKDTQTDRKPAAQEEETGACVVHRDDRTKPSAISNGDAAGEPRPKSSTRIARKPARASAEPSPASISTAATTWIRPPSLTQFRFPTDTDEPELLAKPTVAQSTRQNEAKAPFVPGPTAKVPSLTLREDQQFVTAPESPAAAQQQEQLQKAGRIDPVANPAPTPPLPPSPRLAQKPQLLLRPLLSQWVTSAMNVSAAELSSCSVSSTTSVSFAADAPPPSSRRLLGTVVTSSEFAQRPAMTSNREGRELSATMAPRPHALSHGSSPEVKAADSRSQRSPSTYAVQPFCFDVSPPDWRASLVAGVRLRRDSPHTSRPRYPLCSRSGRGGRVTSLWSSTSPGAWDGLMRSASAEREASLLTKSALPSGSYTTFRRAGPQGADHPPPSPRPTSPSAALSRTPTPARPLLSTIVYPVFHATTIGAKYALTDPASAEPSLHSDAVQIIREELELQSYLNKLKADSLRRRAERNRYH